jgi:tetratricopeptide (TPR) repeat protein
LGIARTDWGVLALLLLTAALSGVFFLFFLPAVHLPPSFLDFKGEVYSPNLVVSAMVATGRGFAEPLLGDGATEQYPEAPELGRFLRRQRPDLSPNQIPTSLRTQTPTIDWAYRHRYLFYTIGALWRVFGISWNVVTMFCIVLHCAMVGLVYGLMRLGMGRLWSLAGTLILTVLPFNFDMVHTNVRDMGKGPFILAAMLVMGWLVTRAVSRRKFLGLSALLGLIIGVGVGFRADVLACLPPSLFVLAFCRRPRTGAVVGERLAAISLLILSFLAPAWPMMGVYSGGSLFAHDILMGLSTKCDDMLGTNRASYEKLYVNEDSFVTAMSTGFSERAAASGEPVAKPADERAFLLRIVSAFPGDMLTRVYSSVLWVIRAGIPSRLFGVFMALLAVTALLVTARRDLRAAWIALFLLLCFCGYLSLQPERRHAFHLTFIPLFLFGCVMDRAVPAVRQASLARIVQRVRAGIAEPRRLWTPSVKRMMQFAVPAAVLLIAPLYAARACQDAYVGKLLDRYAAPDLISVKVKSRQVQGWTMFDRVGYAPMHSGMLHAPRLFSQEYWMAEFAPHTEWRPIWLQYVTGKEAAPGDSFSHGFWVAPCGGNNSGNTRYFFPVVEVPDMSQKSWTLFSGIAVHADQAGDFRGLYKVCGDRDFPLSVNLSFPADRNSFRRHQTLWGQCSTELDADAARCWLHPMPAFRIPPLNGAFAPQETAEAVKAYQEELTVDPQNALLRLGLAVCQEPQTDNETALKAYGDALAADPCFYVTYHYIDAFLKRRGDASGRVAFWRDLVREYPGNYLPSFHLGFALAECQDSDGALEAYRRVIELCPSDAGTLSDVGCLLARKNANDAAVETYRRVLQMDPLDTQTENNLKMLLSGGEHH